MSLYSTKAWKRLRQNQLQDDPWCAMCAKQGHLTPATVVDHIEPHRGDERAFFLAANLQSLCKQHHDSAKQRFEKSGIKVGGDVRGIPHDPKHHWRNAA